MASKHSIECPYCKGRAALVSGLAVYPHRPDLARLKFYVCGPCDARVGTHRGTVAPLGPPANAALRTARSRAHAAFDPLWRYHKRGDSKRRDKAYAWLALQLGLTKDECYIRMMNYAQCALVVAACEKLVAERKARAQR